MGDSVEGYLFSRGATQGDFDTLGLREWEPSRTPAPSHHFVKRYGDRGQALTGMIFVPLWSPSGGILGFEARTASRNPGEKKISEFRVPEASWNPFLIGAKGAAEKLWAGGSVWVCEGLYDLLALQWVVPKTDAVVATLKAGLSKSHVLFFSRLCRNRVYMVYDNDDTGRRATVGWYDDVAKKHRPGALTLLSKAGLNAVDYRYGGKDPGEVWSSGGYRKLQTVFNMKGEIEDEKFRRLES